MDQTVVQTLIPGRVAGITGKGELTISQVLEKAEEDSVKFVDLVFTDIKGVIKSVTIPVTYLKDSLENGTWFDGSSIEGFTKISESDMYLKPDPSTYAILPWSDEEERILRLICDVYTADGKPFEGDPRYILKKAMHEAAQLGFFMQAGPELEFFLFKPREPGKDLEPHDNTGYFDFAPRDAAVAVRGEIVKALEAMGMEVEMSHHEVAPGQHEIDFRFSNAVKTADNAITLKQVVKTIAHHHGLHATFMPKPLFGQNGSGMHTHQSLADINTGKNVFPGDGLYGLSDIARHYVGGVLKHIRSLSAVIAPTVNSYKRLVPGYEAPVYIAWGQRNRSALIRIPRAFPGRTQAIRIEVRCPDPSSNPYLAFAVMLKAGLDGIKNKIAPPSPIEKNLYHLEEEERRALGVSTLPQTLGEALEELKKSNIAKETLGPHAFPAFLEAKQKEWDAFRLQVTPWELDQYYEAF